MKVALLSDIHANGYAFDTVIKAAKKAEAEHFLITGDFIGYYYNTDRVLELLETIEYTAIRGNHEDMYRTLYPDESESLTSRYGHSFANCENLDISNLLNLPEKKELEINGRTVLMCHGTPWSHDTYLYPDASEDILNRLWMYDKDLVVYGHTHYQVAWKKEGRIIVNPGSVGQPRDYKPGACWALWDTKTNAVTLYREDYDINLVINECLRYDPNKTFIRDVLTRTKAM